MDEIMKARLDAQDQKLDAILASTEKMRRYFLVAMWITIITVVLPLLGLFFALPAFLNTYVGML